MTSLDRLRREAKALRRACETGDPSAQARARAVLGHDGPIRHADALHVLAREAGAPSWPRLKAAEEAARMDRRARATRLAHALEAGQHHVVQALRVAAPDLGRDNLGLICALYDTVAARDFLDRDPGAATRPVNGRRPILHLSFSRHIHGGGDRGKMLELAELLLAHGADVNDGVPAEPGSPHMLSALYGAVGHGDNPALGRWLLDHGATPDDNESLYHATEHGHLDCLRLLLHHGATITGTNALPRMLDFDNAEGVRLLLEAGADPNEGIADHPSGAPPTVIPALHQAARRMCSARTAELLLSYGADGRAPYLGLSAYAFARVFGNRPFAETLERAGQAMPLTETEAKLAAAADGEPPGAIPPGDLGPETARLMTRLIGVNANLGHLQRLAAVGIDPDTQDEMGLDSLHMAGWEGRADVIGWLLTLGPDLRRKNRYGGDVMGTIIHGAEFCPSRARRDHVGCARLVLAAGAPLHRADIRMTGAEEMRAFLEDWADAHPDRLV